MHRKTGVRLLAVPLASLAAYIALRPFLGLGHELAVAGLARLLHAAVATDAWEPVIRLVGLDPIYAGAAIRAAGGIQVAGLAVAGPVGQFLHSLLPALFLGPESVTRHAAISMVAAPGAPALGRGLATFGADVVWLTFGVWLYWRWRRTCRPIAIVGALIQAQIGVNHLLGGHIALVDLDASGLPFALQVALPNGGWFTGALAELTSGVRDLIIGTCLLVLGYAIAIPLVALVVRGRRAAHRARAGAKWSPAMVSVGLALLTAWSPVGRLRSAPRTGRYIRHRPR